MRVLITSLLIILILSFMVYLSGKINLFEIKKKVKPYTPVNYTKFFEPTVKAESGKIKIYSIKSNLKSFRSSLCPKDYPNLCGDKCYQKCDPGFFYCFPNGTGSCIDIEGNVEMLYNKLTQIFESNNSCFLYNIPEKIQETAITIIPNYGSNKFPYLLDIIYLYNWTRKNIKYVPGAYSVSKPLDEILELKAGKCDEQAKLLAAMISAIGGVARVRTVPKCQHAWAEVFIPSHDVQWIADEIEKYTGEKEILYINDSDGIWIPLDTSGATEIGKIMDSCIPWLNDSQTFYYCRSPCEDNYYFYNGLCYSSCPGGTGISKYNKLKCVSCPKEFPYTYKNKCVNSCPPGTGLSKDNKTCSKCPKGYTTYKNICVKCPSGYYLGNDGKCYKE